MLNSIEKAFNKQRNVIRKSRATIDQSDTAILEALFDRTCAVKKIGIHKKKNNMLVKDPTREKEIIERLVGTGETLGLDPELVKDVFTKIIEHSCKTQESLQK